VLRAIPGLRDGEFHIGGAIGRIHWPPIVPVVPYFTLRTAEVGHEVRLLRQTRAHEKEQRRAQLFGLKRQQCLNIRDCFGQVTHRADSQRV